MGTTGILYDLDGTKVNSWPDYFEYMRGLFEAFDRPFPFTAETLRTVVDADYGRMYLELGFDWENNVVRDRILELFFEANSLRRSPVFPLAREAAYALHTRGVPQGVVTNNTEEKVRAVLGASGLLAVLAPIVGWETLAAASPFSEQDPGKPKPRGLLIAAAALGPTVRRVAFVGDTPADIETVRRAQPYTSQELISVGVGYGYSAEAAVLAANPDVYVPTIDRLLPTLESLL